MEDWISEEELKECFNHITETGEIESLLVDGENQKLVSDPAVQNPILLCGSFNPLHEGHMNLLESGSKHFPD